MAIFAVLAPLDNLKIGPALESKFAGNFFRAWNGQWFISASGTPRQIAEQLGIGSEGENGSAIILSVSSYWGRANVELWPWLAARIEK